MSGRRRLRRWARIARSPPRRGEGGAVEEVVGAVVDIQGGAVVATLAGDGVAEVEPDAGVVDAAVARLGDEAGAQRAGVEAGRVEPQHLGDQATQQRRDGGRAEAAAGTAVAVDVAEQRAV